MTKLLFLLFLLISCVQASHLERSYRVANNYVLLSDIIPSANKEIVLLRMQPTKHIIRIQEKKLLTLLQKYGYKDFTSKYPYIQFTQKSPIDTTRMEKAIYELYSKVYNNIFIKSIEVDPRSFMQSLPKNYTIHFPKKTQFSQKLVFYIQTPRKRKIFFNAFITAQIHVFIARKKIHKDEALSSVNTKKKSIMLQKFFAMPLQEIHKGTYQAKHTLHKGKVLTTRDVVSLVYIHRGSMVVVTLHNNGIFISFSAKALQNGRLGEVIKVKSENGKTLKVRVRGTNLAEVI